MMKAKTILFIFSYLLVILMALSPMKGASQNQSYKGWPSAEGKIDIRQYFKNPPKGYGDVPFYWWNGDTLTRERLQHELDLLAEAPVDGLCISYVHTNPEIDTLEQYKNHGGYGAVAEAEPKPFSKEWWDIWNWFSGQCADKGIGLGLDDYVVGWPGNGNYPDEILNAKEFKEFPGRLEMKNGEIVITPSPELHPDFGKKMVEVYFQRFWDKMDDHGRKGMNYFFQDELIYRLDIHSWCPDMPEQFQKRKGYDIRPHLKALFDSSAETAKYRLDYAEVVTQLAEERYFKPIVDWHESHGLIYGCDNEGRGLYPTMYLDYFRAVSHFTAPGNDAPARGSSFCQTKVSSSVSHLYNRPRTWLEAFHSMGWNANMQTLTHQLDHHIIAGGNLMCLHGLYYSTHGGWWEWAPPCFHFRMPYWPHTKLWMKRAEREMFLLSQGIHVADVAVLYPTETLQAYPDSKLDLLWDVVNKLSTTGHDYDFIDYQSLQKANIENGRLRAGKETYNVLLLVGIKAMHEATAEKISQFEHQGGKVVRITSEEEIPDFSFIENPDFAPHKGFGRVLHRHVGQRDVYMVMDITPGDTLDFRSTGGVEVWNPTDGTQQPQEIIQQSKGRTQLIYDGSFGESKIYVFDPASPVIRVQCKKKLTEIGKMALDGIWTVEAVPTLDNTWGDYRLPAKKEIIGVEQCEISARATDGSLPEYNSLFGYGPWLLTANLQDSIPFIAIPESDWEPYIYSWQYGVQDAPGSQGYHGLKSRVDDRFIILDKGSFQAFKTKTFVPKTGQYEVRIEGTKPYTILLDKKAINPDKAIKLRKGWHDLMFAYSLSPKADYALEGMRGSTLDRRQRSAVVIYPEGVYQQIKPQNHFGNIIAMKWYDTPHLNYNPIGGKNVLWEYRFEAAPGMVKMDYDVAGKVVKIDQTSSEGKTIVTITAQPDAGYEGNAFFRSAIKMECGAFETHPGDWTSLGALKYFSGGMRYTKHFNLDTDITKMILDLGEVDASCEVSINGSQPTVLFSSPFSLDITPWIQRGDNEISVLVYSSLSNYYQRIPDPYRGTPRAGLIGPVSLKLYGQ